MGSFDKKKILLGLFCLFRSLIADLVDNRYFFWDKRRIKNLIKMMIEVLKVAEG